MRLAGNHLALILFFVIHPLVSLGQTSFQMTYKEGGYFITTSINNHDNIEILVASGFHGIIVSEDDYDRLFVDSLYQTVDSDIAGIKDFYRKHPVSKVKYGKVSIGDLSYQGNIYVVDKWSKINVPVYLHQYKMMESSPLPIIEATLFISDTYGHLGSVEGRFLFNLNSGSPLYLCVRNPSALNFIRKNKFRILPAQDKAGNEVGKGILAAVCQVGERKRRKVAIGVGGRINLPNVLGCIGPSMFRKSYVVIDSKNHIEPYYVLRIKTMASLALFINKQPRCWDVG